MKLKLSDVEEARNVLLKILQPTPMIRNPWLSKKYNCDVFLKLESMHPIGSFKIRGACYKLSKLSKKELSKGVIAASAGNHAQGVAWAAAHFKTEATIVMPIGAPLTKIQNTISLGAKVVLFGDTYEEAYDHARKIEKKTGAVFVHPYDDHDVISGQGTLGLEILEQLPEADVVIGSIGGGGLMAGVGLVFHTMKPKAYVVGAQASGARSMVESIRKKRVIETGFADTFADGIRVKNVAKRIFKNLLQYVDVAHHADDESIAASVLTLIEKARVISEGAGALPLSVLDQIYNEKPKLIQGKKIVLIVCGGNIDVNVLARIIDRGLTMTGRRVRLNVFLTDKPGSLNNLTKLIAENGANIIQAIHDRDAPSVGLHETGVELTIETKGSNHGAALIKNIKKHFPKLEVLR